MVSLACHANITAYSRFIMRCSRLPGILRVRLSRENRSAERDDALSTNLSTLSDVGIGADVMKILVFLDNPAEALQVVDAVGRMAANYKDDLEIHLSRVLFFADKLVRSHPVREAVGAGIGSADYAGHTPEQAPVDATAAANEYLARLAHRYFPGIATKRVIFGPTPAAEIVAYAEREKINLIAIADQGERGIGKMLRTNASVPLLKVPCRRLS